MELNLKDISSASAQGLFNVGDTVSIVLYKSDQTLETLDSAVCDPFPAPNNDIFQWDYSDITDLPTDYEEYTWIMTNQVGIKQSYQHPSKNYNYLNLKTTTIKNTINSF